jgi:superfamily II DNA helicase RecQ
MELKSKIVTARLNEMSLRESIIEDLRSLNLGPRTTRLFCERELGYSTSETRAILATLGLIVTAETLTSHDPIIQMKIDRLREWRKVRAREQGVPAYRVFPNRVLMAMAAEAPTTPESLRGLKGFGVKRAEVYGPELLKLLDLRSGDRRTS